MIQYVLRRLLSAVPTVFAGVTLVFFAINVIPGDPAAVMLEDYFEGEAYDAMVKEMGLDQPLYVRYVHYLGDIARGDFGTSFRTGRSVSGDILSQLPYTLTLAVSSVIISVILGVTIGTIAAATRNRWPDQLSMVFVLVSISTPSFVFATVLILIFAVRLGWLPALGGGSTDDPMSMLKPLILPAFALGLRSAAIVARLARSAFLDVLNQDYMRTARAKGLRERSVLIGHGLRNAMLPIITITGINLGSLLGGTAIVEIVFNRPGLGKLLVDGVASRDYPMVQGTMLFFITVVILANLLADVGYGVADPRIRVK